MTKAPTATEKPKKQRDNTNTPQKKNFHYTTIADDLRRSTRSKSVRNDSNPTGVVNPVYGIPTLSLTKSVV